MDISVTGHPASVYWALDGGIHHAKCGQRMVLVARHADELDFSCLTCVALVKLPTSATSRIPVAT
jgi:hypothetical protein